MSFDKFWCGGALLKFGWRRFNFGQYRTSGKLNLKMCTSFCISNGKPYQRKMYFWTKSVQKNERNISTRTESIVKD